MIYQGGKYVLANTPKVIANPYTIGGAVSGGSNLYTQYNRDSKGFENLDKTELLVNTVTGVVAGHAKTVKVAMGLAGFGSGVNETYNQVINEKNNSFKAKVKEIGLKTTYGVGVGYFGLKAGVFAKNNLPKTSVIGSIKNTKIKGDTFNKSHKLSLESGSSVIGTTIPNIKEEEK